ncbi:MAG: hypothetical protein QM626_01965 [Microbacterium sp.]|uniref:hypothetical protein n=1 Tax=Microbacterium sp. TaxID=51671 RepID=UPI0039E3F553
MRSTPKFLSFLALSAVLVLGISPAAHAADEDESPTVQSSDGTCATAASALLSQEQVTADEGYDFTCSAGSVVVSVNNADGSTETYSGIVSSAATDDTMSIAAESCNLESEPTRTIVSELQVNIDFCIIYGQNGDPVNGSWARSLSVEWTSYPGYPSVQNRLRTISAYASGVILWGTLTLQKQNGILPPSAISSSVVELRSGFAETDWLVGNVSSDGSHSVRYADLKVTDYDYSFDATVNVDGMTTPRFTCDSEQERCYYPDGQEAGL